jgi:hypothetical protein
MLPVAPFDISVDMPVINNVEGGHIIILSMIDDFFVTDYAIYWTEFLSNHK